MSRQNITALEADKILKTGEALLIDVRQPEEFKERHIPYAISLPLDTIKDDFKKLEIPATRKLIFQCLKGKRGEMACTAISETYDMPNEIYNIEGGIGAWEEAGLPIIGSKSDKISIFRQVQIIAGGLVFLSVAAGASWIAGIIGVALAFAGATGFCGLAMALQKAPWNK